MKIEKVYTIGVLKCSKNIIIVFVRSNAIADVIVDGDRKGSRSATEIFPDRSTYVQ